jgi:hypothetical protein
VEGGIGCDGWQTRYECQSNVSAVHMSYVYMKGVEAQRGAWTRYIQTTIMSDVVAPVRSRIRTSSQGRP